MDIPSVRGTFTAFEAGAKHARRDYQVRISYIGGWDDLGAARAATLALIDRGCRVVFQNADAAGPGVFQAAGERGIYAFGSNRAQHEVAPKVVLASAVLDIPRAFVAIAREVKEGRFHARPIEETMNNGAIAVVYNPGLESAVPAGVRRDVDALIDYRRRAPGVRQALPTHEHFVPVVTALGAAIDDASALPSFPISGFTYGSATRRSLQLG